MYFGSPSFFGFEGAVLAADLAGELGPIKRYANANAITGRSGLFPSRHQSD